MTQSVSVEATGNTLEQARAAARKLLGVQDDACVRYEELPDDRALFGRTRKRVRATLVPRGQGGAAREEAPPPDKGEPVARAADGPQPEPRGARAVVETHAIPSGEITDRDVKAAKDLVQSIVDAAKLRITVRHQETQDKYIHLEMTGPDVPHIIGRKGAVIDSLQYLVNVIYCKEVGPEGPRLVLDADDYRSRRASTLCKLALELAEQVRERGEEAELESLPAHERRIVHQVLKDDATVRTYSEGVEPDRHVIISPAEMAE